MLSTLFKTRSVQKIAKDETAQVQVVKPVADILLGAILSVAEHEPNEENIALAKLLFSLTNKDSARELDGSDLIHEAVWRDYKSIDEKVIEFITKMDLDLKPDYSHGFGYSWYSSLMATARAGMFDTVKAIGEYSNSQIKNAENAERVARIYTYLANDGIHGEHNPIVTLLQSFANDALNKYPKQSVTPAIQPA